MSLNFLSPYQHSATLPPFVSVRVLLAAGDDLAIAQSYTAADEWVPLLERSPALLSLVSHRIETAYPSQSEQ